MREDYVAERIDLLAPGLIRYEVGNALRFHPGSSPRELIDAIRTIAEMQIDQPEFTGEVVETASEIAFQERLTFYDAVYLGLAERSGAKLLTDDRRLYRKARRNRNLIQLLESYKSPGGT